MSANLRKKDSKDSKDRRVTIRLSQDLYNAFNDFINLKSNQIGTKITQAQAFEILLKDKNEDTFRKKGNM